MHVVLVFWASEKPVWRNISDLGELGSNFKAYKTCMYSCYCGKLDIRID